MRSVPYFDAHCDTLTACDHLRNNHGHLDIQRLQKYSPCAQIFAICTPEHYEEGFRETIPKLISELQENSDVAVLCRSAEEISCAWAEGKTAVLLAVEGCDHFACSLDGLQTAYSLGVRSVNLTWNHDNILAGAALGSGRGLTEQGTVFVRKAQTMGIILDLSHASEQTFWDVLKITERPVYATHSNAFSLCPHPRNLTDQQFEALVQCGGGAGINLYPEFLGLSHDLDAIIAHIEHILSLGGEKSIFLGSDFDGIDQTPIGISGVQDMDVLYEALLKRNYPERLVRDIFYLNLLNILERSL